MRNFPDTDIYLKEPEHVYLSYSRPDVLFKSATTFIKRFFPSFDALGLARNLIKKGAVKYGNFKNTTEILKNWKEKGERGTLVHNEIDSYLTYNTPMTHDLSHKARVWLELVLKSHRYKLFSEQRVGVPELKLAGTIDLLVYDTWLKEWLIVDWKTNETIYESAFGGAKGTHWATVGHQDCNYVHYTLQLSLYRWILETFYGFKVNSMYLVHLRDKTTKTYPMGFKTYPITYDYYTIMKMVKAQQYYIHEGDVFTDEEVVKFKDLNFK